MTPPKSLLALPAEIRSKIWRYCVESLDDSVTMCPCEARPSCKHTFSSLTAVSQVSSRSCEADYSERAIYTTTLNLIFINKQLRSEAEHLYSTKVLKFCSRVCFTDLLRTIENGYEWIKKIEIAIDLRPLRVGFSYSSARYLEMLGDEMELLSDFTNRYFSSCSFAGREIWKAYDVTGATQHEYIVTGDLMV